MAKAKETEVMEQAKPKWQSNVALSSAVDPAVVCSDLRFPSQSRTVGIRRSDHRAESEFKGLCLSDSLLRHRSRKLRRISFGNLKGFLESAIDPNRVMMMPPIEEHAHAVTGPELMELMRNKLPISVRESLPMMWCRSTSPSGRSHSNTLESGSFQAKTVIIATGARANYLGLPSEEAFKNRGSEPPVRFATAPCHASARNPWWLSVVVIPLSKKPAILPSMLPRSTC